MIKVLVQGIGSADALPGIEALPDGVELTFAADDEALSAYIEDAEVLFGRDAPGDGLRKVWPRAQRLRWVQWGGAGVDAALFPELRVSDVVLTNGRGVHDRAMAEYALGLMIAMAKGFPRSLVAQWRGDWDWRHTELLAGRRVLVVGVGSIGREIARMLIAFGMRVEGVGRSRRERDPVFGTVHASSLMAGALAESDYVVVAVPSTPATQNLFGEREFDAMPAHARFINLARGSVVEETALVEALRGGRIAGAALDVFGTEPLPADSPLWRMPNVIVSPHMSGDHLGAPRDLVALFLDNLERYRRGAPLRNVVDKSLGFVAPQG